MDSVFTEQAAKFAVIVRLDRTIQYAATSVLNPKRLRLLDTRIRGYDDHWWSADV
jgi:hypothetical protein